MKCKQCLKEFNNKRKSAKFCSSGCRLKYFRGVSVSDSVSKRVSVSKAGQYKGSYLYQLCPKHPGSMKITCGCK